MTDDSIPQKQCRTCGEIKPLDMFHRNNGKKDGRQPCCKMCIAKRYEAKAEAICKKKRTRYHASIEEHRAAQRAYRTANIERTRAHNRAYHIANPDYRRAYYAQRSEIKREYNRAYHAAHAETIRMRMRAYQAAHLEEDRARRHNRRALLKGNGGSYTAQEIKKMRAEQAGICAYCHYQHNPDRLTIDHILPITKGGSNNISNICLACWRCNLTKHARTLEEWVNRWYLRED